MVKAISLVFPKQNDVTNEKQQYPFPSHEYQEKIGKEPRANRKPKGQESSVAKKTSEQKKYIEAEDYKQEVSTVLLYLPPLTQNYLCVFKVEIVLRRKNIRVPLIVQTLLDFLSMFVSNILCMSLPNVFPSRIFLFCFLPHSYYCH